ncbi:2'-5' RNA ligase family protein [Myxococcota bacterium]|nr:2'-5' RNA ligase family protein [Myxococcota bacterium]
MTPTPMTGRGLSLWWMLPPGLEAPVQGLIDGLAGRLGSPAFRPHVTVEGGLSGHPEELIAALAGAPAARTSPRLRQVGISTGEAWNHLLALDLERTEALGQARIEVMLALGRTVAPGGWRPHLSLAYGTLPEATRRAMAAQLKLELPPFHPVALALWDTRGPVAEWWELHRWPLAAAPEP